VPLNPGRARGRSSVFLKTRSTFSSTARKDSVTFGIENESIGFLGYLRITHERFFHIPEKSHLSLRH
jgi:hypothetical protein